jgi:transposase
LASCSGSFWRAPEGGWMIEAEVIGRRRKWTPEQKATLLAEVEAEGGRVSLVARRHGISESLLYNWRSAWKAACSLRDPEPMEFVSLGVIGPSGDEARVMLTASDQSLPPGGPRPERVGMIEIDLPGGVRVRVDAFVNEKALHRVFRAMKGVM